MVTKGTDVGSNCDACKMGSEDEKTAIQAQSHCRGENIVSKEIR